MLEFMYILTRDVNMYFACIILMYFQFSAVISQNRVICKMPHYKRTISKVTYLCPLFLYDETIFLQYFDGYGIASTACIATMRMLFWLSGST